MLGFRTDGANAPLSEKEQRWQEYLDGIANRDAQCLARLYDECSAMLLALALRMTKNDADAEEIILDVFEQVWRTAPSFDPARGSVWRWLVVLVRSRALDRLRAASSRHDRGHITISNDWDLASQDALPDRNTIFNEERTLIKSALLSLPEEQRQAVELAYFSGLTHVEIAASLNLPLGTVKTRIRSAMEKLRALLRQGGPATAGLSE